MNTKIKTFNSISSDGINLLNKHKFEVSENCSDPDGILLRSHKLKESEISTSVKAVGRAGAGVNNIPVEFCTDKGIVVFNTPGANANAVKELVLTSLLLSSRDIIGGLEYVKSLNPTNIDINKEVESNKSRFKGHELLGKKIGVIGLGAIGMMVANCVSSLGMDVSGYDPFITVNNAWSLSSQVKRAENLTAMVAECDFITLHMPLTKNTKYFVGKDLISKFKKGCKLLNFSRSEIVNEEDIEYSLDSNILSLYCTDFPSSSLINHKKVFSFPHLGASTVEAENNCAVMIANQVQDYLLNGNIRNSVNFPNCSALRMGAARLCIVNKNIPNMVGQITSILANNSINIQELVNKSRDNIAYNIVDLEVSPSDDVVNTINNIDGVLSVRLI